ncbi:MAG: GDP-mannose 4,6-dehydratase [archaeon]
MTKSFITGISGFAGSHLTELLLKEGHEVTGFLRPRSDIDNIKHLQKDIMLLDGDILDPHSIELAINEAQPDYVFHLAGQSFVPQSWRAPANTMEINAVGTINLLEAIKKQTSKKIRVQIAGSSEEYGYVSPEEIPIKETNPLRPQSPYGVSKVAEDLLAVQYHRSYGIETIVTRGFNHEGPRRGKDFVTSTFARQIVEIERGREPIIYVGNLNAKRDFTDVRDMVRGYLCAVEKGKAGEQYNLCSNKAHSIQEMLDIMLSYSNMKDKIEIKQDPKRMRPSDVPLLYGSYEKFKKETGWEPEIPLEKTLKDLLDYWREKR